MSTIGRGSEHQQLSCGAGEDHEDAKALRVEEIDALLRRIFSDQCGGPSEHSAEDASNAEGLLLQVREILDEYQEQPYLLDPHMARIIALPIKTLQDAVRGERTAAVASEVAEDTDVQRSARFIYMLTKVRGFKVVTSYFPHEVGDLIPTLNALRSCIEPACVGGSSYDRSMGWELRYVLLLWLSLVCMIPFDLDKFSGATSAVSIADNIVSLAQHFLESPGKERDAAALVLGKVLQRRDLAQSHLGQFIEWCLHKIEPPAEPSPFLAAGILQSLCELNKTVPTALVLSHFTNMQVVLMLGEDSPKDNKILERLRTNSLINRYRCKLACRMAIKLLPPSRTQMGRTATAYSQAAEDVGSRADPAESCEVPEQVDGFIAQLLSGLQDRDTIVRYSAAKGLARICERLPVSYASQIADAVTQLFEINALRLKDGEMDLSAVSEHTWQGACLGLAEMVRRGQLSHEDLTDKLQWVQRALFLDIRRGSHSNGTAVRDAACYVLWSLARAYPKESLRPFSLSLAQRLVILALMDREISIRRAASAAFQECVGRLGLFPHGIDVVGKTDFYSVGIRRKAFLECLPDIACHIEYRLPILDHLLSTVIGHWDVALRILGAQAVGRVLKLDFGTLAPYAMKVVQQHYASSRDSLLLHGLLLTLAEIGHVCAEQATPQASSIRSATFGLLERLPRQTMRTVGPPMLLEAACHLIAASVTSDEVVRIPAPAQTRAAWEECLDAAVSRPEDTAHEAGAHAYSAVSAVTNCDDVILTNVRCWREYSKDKQQGLALALGSIRHTTTDALIAKTSLLTTLITPGSVNYAARVEVRRNAIKSIVSTLTSVDARTLVATIDPEIGQKALGTLLQSLHDYSMDQRGDVGSWVRLAAVSGLRTMLDHLQEVSAETTPRVRAWLSEAIYHDAVAGIAKQMVERMDHIRAEAGSHFLHLYQKIPTYATRLHQPLGDKLVHTHFAEAFANADSAPEKLRDAAWLFPRAVKLLLIPRYRPQVLHGLVQSVATRTELSHRIVASAMADFASANHESYGPGEMLDDLLTWLERDWAKSGIAVAIMQSVTILLQADDIGSHLAVGTSGAGGEQEPAQKLLERAVGAGARSIAKVKVPQRLTATLEMVVSVLRLCVVTAPAIRVKLASRELISSALTLITSAFLGHTYPSIRSQAAEKLYILVSELDDELGECPESQAAERDAAEDLLLTIPWGDDWLEDGASGGNGWTAKAAEVEGSIEPLLRLKG
ncbi:unnamed protein product [Parajaminaea phylloscopi]